MEVIRETLWKRCLSTPIKPLAKNSNICLSETAYQHIGTRKKCKKTNQVAIIQWQRQCPLGKPHRKPWPKSKTSHISKQSPSSLHHTFLLGRARFTAQPLSALGLTVLQKSVRFFIINIFSVNNFKLSELKSGKWFGQWLNNLSKWLRKPLKGTLESWKLKISWGIHAHRPPYK